MAKYTVTIKDLITNNFDLGLKDYPIYDESHRETLNNMIINHYLMSEIGQETPALFKLYLNNTMNEIMPKYNILYRAVDEYVKRQSILSDVDLTIDSEGSTENNALSTSVVSSNGSSSEKSKMINSDTPQGKIYLNDLENQAYATTAAIGSNENSSNSSSNSTNKTDNDTVNKNKTHTFGSNGKLPIDVMIKIQQGILNIDESIIKELQPLFFGLY